MAQSEAEFLAVGIRRYAEACETIRAFREKLADRLIDVLTARDSFGAFQRDSHLPRRQRRFSQTQDWGQWVLATATGTVNGRQLGIEIGVWWYGKEGMPPVMFYVSTTETLAQKLPSGLNLPPGMKVVEDVSGRPYLYLAPGEPLDFERDFELLIGAFASHYGTWRNP